MDLVQQVRVRLASGTRVLVVIDPDEALAVEAARAGAATVCAPVAVCPASAEDVADRVARLREQEGTLITMDLLRVLAKRSEQFIRIIREVALAGQGALIMVEHPGVDIPQSLPEDIGIIVSKLPAVKEIQDELEDFIKAQGTAVKAGYNIGNCARALTGLTRNEAVRLAGQCVVEQQGRMDEAWLRKEKAARISEKLSGALQILQPDIVPVGGSDNLQRWLETRRRAFASEEAKAYGLPESKGVLLLGVQGCGKSLTSKYIAKAWEQPLVRLDVGKLFSSLVGSSEAQTRAAISAVEEMAPCVLWIDEVEKAFAGTKGGGNDSGTSMRVFGSFLTWLQEKTVPVFVVATANRVQDLPPEFLRKGRFDEIFFVDLPSQQERYDILKIHLEARKQVFTESEINRLASITAGFSGAELEQAVIDGMFRTFSEDRKLTASDVEEAIKATVPLSTTMSDDIAALRAWAKTRARPASSLGEAPAPFSGRRRPVVVKE